MQALVVSLAENLHAIVAIVATVVSVWATVRLRRSRTAARREQWKLRQKQTGGLYEPSKVDISVNLSID